jgi:hypothetical protein
MEDGRKVALQSFTRVHLVPRVNGAAAAALVFERRDQEPLAMSVPLEVMGQVFGVLPQVIAQSSAEAGVAATPLDVPTPWVLDQLELQRDGEQARLLVQVQGVRLQLQLQPEMVLALAKQLGGGRKAAKPSETSGEKAVVEKAVRVSPVKAPKPEGSRKSTAAAKKPKAAK